jgi:aspartyl/asparaginyl-tRNA synthetase
VVVLKKVWAFLKTYWYIPVLIIVAIVLKSKSKSVEEVLEAARDSHKKQLDAIDNAEKEKQKSRDIINSEYDNAIKKIEEEFTKKNKALDTHQKSYVKAVVKNWSDDPDQMAERISLKFGFHYVPKTNNSDTD